MEPQARRLRHPGLSPVPLLPENPRCAYCPEARHTYQNEYPNGGATSGHSGRLEARDLPPAPNLAITKKRKLFTLPDDIFYLNLVHGPITVYAYPLYCEDRRTHQRHPSYNTIADVTGLSVNTVMKHVTTYVDKQFSTVEHTSYINDKGMKWTGNNCYAILPVQQAIEAFYQQGLSRLKDDAEHHQIAKLLHEQESPA